MAYYAALVSVVQLLKDITLHHQYPNFLLDKHQLHVSLYEKFNLLLEMLDDYSPKDHEEQSNGILERRIRNAAYHAQDLVESRISTPLLPHVHLENRTHGVERVRRHLGSTFRKPLDCIAKKKYYRDLGKVRTEVDSILEELIRIKAESSTVLENLLPNSYISVEASRVQELSRKNTMFVFNDDLMTTIKAQLCGESSKLEVISIAGMGGLGKTTLARNIFDDRLTHDHFDCRVWVTISQDYHLENILQSIVKSLNCNKEELDRDEKEEKEELDRDEKKKNKEELDRDGILQSIVNSLNINKEELVRDEKKKEELARDEKKKKKKKKKKELRENIYKNLFGRRYLIVMDDVWETKLWDDIRRVFPDNSNGSRIIITTRLSNVADSASSSNFHHQMQFLNEDQSWNLLREKVFGQKHCPKELEFLGKLIANNCRGLPLAIVIIAGVLANVKRSQHNWENIARKVSSIAIDQNDEHLSTILSLSYNHLPHYLKPCFLYLGGYPEDQEIRISKLIRLWVAEGFLKPNESKSLEEMGEEYLRDLVNRNLVLITRKKSNGKFKFCIIHDVLRDLCSQRAHDENFLLCVRQKHDFQRVSIENVRRVYVQTLGGDSFILKYIKKHGSHVRSLIYCSPHSCFENDSLLATSGSKMLRILDTRATICYSEADEILELLQFSSEKIFELRHFKITELLHLRYVNLRLDDFHVPPRIFHLQNLQTLILYTRESLPSEIWKMPQLRHVISKKGVTLPPIPYDEVRIIDGVPLLGSLQTLSIGENFRFDTIEMIPNLKKLGFKCSSKGYQFWEDYGLGNLVHLHQLETLSIWFVNYTWGEIPLPENFAFSSTLIKLTLEGCKLPWKDMSVVGSLPNLQVLKLRSNAFLGEEWEPIEEEFLKLKFLEMDRLSYLKYWRAENTHFPCLESLHIRYCDALEEIPLEIGDIPTLQLIYLAAQNSALRSSALEIQEQQRELGNDDLQVLVDGWDYCEDYGDETENRSPNEHSRLT